MFCGKSIKLFTGSVFLLTAILTFSAFAQDEGASPTPSPEPTQKQKKITVKADDGVRTMTVPISIFSKEEIKENQLSEFIEAGNIFVKEAGDQQTVLSLRSVSNTPLYLSVIIQDDLESVVNLELKNLGNFIRRLPKGSRVMVAYLRAGGLQITQRFTEDLGSAADSLRVISGSAAAATGDPYDSLSAVLDRYDGLPTGRRAVLMITDGFDTTAGASQRESVTLERAIAKAQRRSIPVYAIYSSGVLTANGGTSRILAAQGALNKLTEETGGKAFFQGTSTPVNYSRFLEEIDKTLTRQFALTYLSTHLKKNYYRIEVYSSNPNIKIEHPKGYRYRGR